MTFTVLVALVALNAGPSIARDASLVGTEAHHKGFLVAQNDAPPPPPPLEQAPPSPPPSAANLVPTGNYDGWSVEQLRAESRRLSDNRPSIVGPIVLLAVGAGLGFFIGAPFTYLGVAYFLAGYGVGALVFGLAVLLPAIAMIIVGCIWLGARISERRAIGEQIDEIERRIPNAPGGGGNQPAGVRSVEQYRPVGPMMELARF